jgi:light-regulated signal transduction histidine kinase (bacteriophytochrome)
LRKFVGQLNHDLRNHLNAIELQAACLNETAREAETASEIKRLREMTGDLCNHLQRLSASLAGIQPNTMGYLAAEFLEDLPERYRATALQSGAGGTTRCLSAAPLSTP